MANEHDSHSAGTEVPGGAGHSDVFPPFDTNHFGAQLVWLAITFGALYLLMSRIALPRVAAILENRQSTISGDLDRASAMQKQADEAGKAYEKTLADAKANAQSLAQETQAKLNGQIAAAEVQIADTKARALTHVDAIAADAATAIVQQLTGKTPDADSIARAVAATKTA